MTETKNDGMVAADLHTETTVAAVPPPVVATPPIPALASTVTEFMVPVDKQERLRTLDQQGGALHKELGALEIFYLGRKTMFLGEFERNRKEYQDFLNEIAKAVGVDFAQMSANEHWAFDYQKMTFRKVTEPAKPPQV
jgi:hypothetical protein